MRFIRRNDNKTDDTIITDSFYYHNIFYSHDIYIYNTFYYFLFYQYFYFRLISYASFLKSFTRKDAIRDIKPIYDN